MAPGSMQAPRPSQNPIPQGAGGQPGTNAKTPGVSPAAPPAATTPAQAPGQQGQREQQVHQVIEQMHTLIVQMAESIWQIKLTEDQVRELALKMLTQLSDSVKDITIERVKDIARDLIQEETKGK